MEKYTIVSRPDQLSEKLERKAEKCLNAKGFTRDDEHPDVVIVIGGDGTFIYAVHQYMHMINDVCFFGIHTGTLGFYSDYLDSDISEFLHVLIEKKGTLKEFQILQAVTGTGKKFYGINEIRIENAARTQVLDVSINGHMLETFRGSGMCVCTQLGSTAYNRSLGGAVIQEGLDLIEMAEISGIHHSRFRSLDAPMVLMADSVIRFEATSFDGALLGTDAQVYSMDGETSVEISVCRDRKLRLLRGREFSYFDRLKSLF